MEGQMHLSGQLSDWSINDLLQIMQVTAKTGSLDITGERHGRVHFSDGRVTGAELIGAKGSYIGEDRGAVADILYVLSTFEDGSFQVGAADGPDGKGWTVEEILVDVDALRSLEGEVVDAGLFEAAGVRLVSEISEPLTIEPEDWQVFAALVPPFTFGQLEARDGRGGAVRLFHTLHRLGMAHPIVGEEGESDWLDRLADEVAPADAEPNWLPEKTDEDEDDESEVTTEPEPEAETEIEVDGEAEDEEETQDKTRKEPVALKGVAAPASTTLTDGVYDEIRRLRSRVSDS